MTNPQSLLFLIGTKWPPDGFVELLRWGEMMYIFKKGTTPNAIHISYAKVTGQERVIYLKGGTLVRASARLRRTRGGGIKIKKEMK